MKLIRQCRKLVKRVTTSRMQKDKEEMTEEELDLLRQKMEMLNAASRRIPTK